MGSLWTDIALVLVLVVVNAVLAGSEMAFVTLREGQIDRLERESKKGAAAAALARDPNRFLATVQVGITLAGFLASAAAAVSIAEPLVGQLGFLGRAAEPAAVIIVTLVLAYVSLVLGELAPKRVALQRAEGWAVLFARPLTLISTIARPAVWLLSHSTDVVVRMMGGDPAVRREEMTRDELRDIITSRLGTSRLEKTMMEGALDIGERSLREIVVPRTSVVSIQADAKVDQAIAVLLDAGISRAPVVGESIDDVIGMVHLRDLVGRSGTVSTHAKPATAFPETLSVVTALAEMQKNRTHLAVVVDEYGGTEGVVSIEDILEEVVGEIYDEFDRDIAKVERLPDGTVEVPGNFPMHDMQELGIELPEGEFTTVGGLLMDRLGRMPVSDDEIMEGTWSLRVLGVRGRQVERVAITRCADSEE